MPLAVQAGLFIIGMTALGAFATLCRNRPGIGFASGATLAGALAIFLLGSILTGNFLKSSNQPIVEEGCGMTRIC